MALPTTLEACRELVLEIGRIIREYEKCTAVSPEREKLLLKLYAEQERAVKHLETLRLGESK